MSKHELFEAVITHREVPQDPRLAVLIWWATRFAELGLSPSYGPGDHGNLSCRTPQGFLITARATAKAHLRAEHFVEVLGVDRGDLTLTVRCRGLRLPSTDTPMHLAVYETRPDVHAIIHGHDEKTLAKARELKLPVTVQSAAVPSFELIDEVCRLVRDHEYVLLRDHGFLAVGRSIDEAGELVRLLCRNARSL